MRANLDLYGYADDPTAYAADANEWLEEVYDEAYAYEEYVYAQAYAYGYPAPRPRLIDYLNSQVVVAFLLIMVFVYGALSSSTAVPQPKPAVQISSPITQEMSLAVGQAAPPNPAAPVAPLSSDALTVVAPYANYRITQGVHGYSYGHMAVDLAAGRGEPVLSPINGSITASYLDEYGNTTLVIENEVYTVTMLHGEYSVKIGDKVSAGQQVGVESNKGYTMDMAGNLCYNREWCGNHTHLNIYDKRLRSNVNPLDFLGG